MAVFLTHKKNLHNKETDVIILCKPPLNTEDSGFVWFESVIAKVCVLACSLGKFVFGAFFMSCFNYFSV